MTKTIKSFTSDTQYFTTIDEETGKMTDCRCPDHATWCPNRKGGCKHMQSYNAAYERALAFQTAMAQYDVRSIEAAKAARREAYCREFQVYGEM